MTLMTAVRVQPIIPALPDKVYRAWLEPELIRRWLAPAGLEVTRAEVAERVSGHYRIWHAGTEGEVGGFECELLEIVPHERILLRWGFVGPDRLAGPTYDSQLTVTLREAPDGATELTLQHERLDDLREALPAIANGVGPGWEMALDKLAALAQEAL
jgi:uncharacterized protein YndB with AHSA1/START domain